ncbi:unnamed protein product, partial [marine sediment metagenome]
CQGLKGQELLICRNKQKTDVRQNIKKLDANIKNVVSRADGTLEVYVKKQSENTKYKVLNFINNRNLTWSFTKIDFHEVGG